MYLMKINIYDLRYDEKITRLKFFSLFAIARGIRLLIVASALNQNDHEETTSQMHETPLKNALIMGASSGIGYAMAERLATDPGIDTLVLCSRRALSSPPLLSLQSQLAAAGKQCWLLDADITDEASLSALTGRLRKDLQVIDLIINTAGLLHSKDLAPEKALEHISLHAMQQVFAVNAYGPILLAQSLMPWLKARRPVVFASLSARVGSISDNRLGGWYSYRASKAAQNQLLKTLAIELARRNPEAIVLALHPGTTDTGLSRPFQANVAQEKLFTPAFVAEQLLNQIMQATVEDTGSFIAWDGQRIAW
jgi:NAD(P)-dependent dehydrogenase (short-subunit alcohol dehydrogenase family)